MTRDKAQSPLGDHLPSEFDSGKERVRKTVRGKADRERESLFTSSDLFGEIIDELARGEQGQDIADAAGTGSGLESRTVGREPVEEADSVKARPPRESREAPPEHYSVVDLAYSALLQDSGLTRQIRGAEEGPKDQPKPSETDPSSGAPYGEYQLLDRIATGGMAEVFRARRRGVEGFEKIVAVKRILPHLSDNIEFVEMFINEAKMVADLSHPNIVQIFELGKIGDSYYIAMEYVDGKDLRAVLSRLRRKEDTLHVDLAALIATKIGSALDYAHRYRDGSGKHLRIVHRDVSPPNILISREGEVKLVDFGIAKAAIKAPSTDTGTLRGKLLYMSAEQAWGRPIDNRSDIFSLGVVLFEMLTGRNLFMGTSDVSILERVREARFLTPSSFNPAIPIELEAVVARALKKDPSERYQVAAEMLQDLEGYLRRRPAVASADLARALSDLFDTGRVEPGPESDTKPGA